MTKEQKIIRAKVGLLELANSVIPPLSAPFRLFQSRQADNIAELGSVRPSMTSK
jgi:hypothetical protein